MKIFGCERNATHDEQKPNFLQAFVCVRKDLREDLWDGTGFPNILRRCGPNPQLKWLQVATLKGLFEDFRRNRHPQSFYEATLPMLRIKPSEIYLSTQSRMFQNAKHEARRTSFVSRLGRLFPFVFCD